MTIDIRATITLDDAVNPTFVPAIVDVLREKNVW